MRISSISSTQQGYVKKQVMSQSGCSRQNKENYNNISQPSFKSDKGTLIGMGVGALTGLGLTALIVATGGLAAIVAPVGATGVGAAGAGAGAQVGGIIGGLASGPENGKKND